MRILKPVLSYGPYGDAILCHNISVEMLIDAHGPVNRTIDSAHIVARVIAVYIVFANVVTEESYNSLEKSTPPEIRRSNLATVILHLKALGIDNVLRFNFITVSLQCC